jgi:hypothetical protein
LNRIIRFVLLGLAALLIGPVAIASGSPRGEAERALAEAEALFGDGSSAATVGGRGGTLVLRDLALAIPSLSPADRQRARSILQRPSQGSDPDSFGEEAPGSPLCDARFCVHWGAGAPPPEADVPPDGVPDYVESVLEAAARSYSVENASLGWRDPVLDQGRGGGPEVDIYLVELERNLFGYTAPDPGQAGRSRSAYLVIDNDYKGFSGDPIELMQVTLAHEYNHVLHFAYDTFQDVWMFESTATWIEDLVYPEIDDYLQFVTTFARHPGRPMAEEDRGASKLYGSAMWNHWLTAAHSAVTVRQAWAVSAIVRPVDFAVAAYDRSIKDSGGRSFSREFARFAAATAEWNSSASFPDAGSYPDVKRSGRLRRRGKRLRLDHTAYRLYRVRGRGRLRLSAHAERGTRSAIALVGRRGPRAGGAVTTAFRYLPRGGRGVVRLPRGRRFDRVTAVVVNADGRIRGSERQYARDGRRFKVAVSR